MNGCAGRVSPGCQQQIDGNIRHCKAQQQCGYSILLPGLLIQRPQREREERIQWGSDESGLFEDVQQAAKSEFPGMAIDKIETGATQFVVQIKPEDRQ